MTAEVSLWIGDDKALITAALSFLFLFCLVYGRLPLPALIVISTGIAIALLINSRHEHNEFISIDVVAQLSRLKRVNALLKIATLLLLMIICVASQTVWTGVFLCTVMLFLTVLIGGIKLHEYLQILALPVSFLLISGLVLLFEARPEPEGVISIAFFSQWLCISQAAQLFAGLVVARALGAISCLLTMGMSTTMPEII
ncbi:MAG: hypothetical protein FWD45_06990, partial [Coriobacteriia bacterium]|nr:hypothetical protein [Coriobacteriia bacterium]